MWLSGGDPYQGPSFFSTYANQFGRADTFHQWFYPPTWYLPASALARCSFEQATRIWGGISLLALVAGAALLARAFATRLAQPVSFLFTGQLLFLALLQDTAISLSIGQTSALLYLGIACVLCALAESPETAARAARAAPATVAGASTALPVASASAPSQGGTARAGLLVIGLTLVALKPNIGLVIWFLAIGSGAWAGLAWACLVQVLLAVPAMLANGVVASLAGFLANVAHYRSVGIEANLPPDQTGLVNLASLVLHVTPSTGLLVALAAALAWLFGWRAHAARPAQPVRSALPMLLLVVALMLALVPLHSYDMVLMAIPMLALVRAQGVARFALLLAALVTLRAPALGERFGLHHPASLIFPGSLLESLGCVFLLVGCALAVFPPRTWRAQKKTPQG